MRAAEAWCGAHLCGLALMVAACTQVDRPETELEPGEPARLESAPAGVEVVRGFLVLGPEVRSIKPCDEDRELWVMPGTATREAYEELSREPYAPVFVEVEGVVGEPPASGGGADYAAQLTVSDLRRAAPADEGFGCREDLSGVAFRASGVEPFWGLRVSGGSIVYSTPDIPETMFDGADPVPSSGGWVYESVSAGPESIAIRLTLSPERCRDSMVGAIYTWTAEVDIGGVVRRGCAYEGALAPGR